MSLAEAPRACSVSMSSSALPLDVACSDGASY